MMSLNERLFDAIFGEAPPGGAKSRFNIPPRGQDKPRPVTLSPLKPPSTPGQAAIAATLAAHGGTMSLGELIAAGHAHIAILAAQRHGCIRAGRGDRYTLGL